MNQSTNYNFNLPEGTDLVNLLTQLIPNWSDLDTILKGVENQAFTNCTEVTSLGVHAISRTNSEGKILKWIATSNFTAGETFTVDGNVVAAATPAGATLATGAYVTGAIVIAALNSDESAMTIFVSGTNVATDSERLGGELPSYYAKNSDMDIAEQAITDLDNLMGTTSISAIGDGTVTGAISSINGNLPTLLWTNNSPSTAISTTSIQFDDAWKLILIIGCSTDGYNGFSGYVPNTGKDLPLSIITGSSSYTGNGYTVGRFYSLSSNGKTLSVNQGFAGYTNANLGISQNNSVAIPLYIYGIDRL